MHPLLALLAAPDPREIRYVYVWGAVVILMVLVSYFVYTFYKRWMNESETEASPGFTLSDLRKLRDQGQISAEEYEQTRANMVAAAKKMTEKMPDVLPRRSGGAAGNDRDGTGSSG